MHAIERWNAHLSKTTKGAAASVVLVPGQNQRLASPREFDNLPVFIAKLGDNSGDFKLVATFELLLALCQFDVIDFDPDFLC